MEKKTIHMTHEEFHKTIETAFKEGFSTGYSDGLSKVSPADLKIAWMNSKSISTPPGALSAGQLADDDGVIYDADGEG